MNDGSMTDDGPRQQPLELILARNLISIVQVAAFLTDAQGDVLFYNEAAGEILGRSFEETGRLTREQWNAIGPVDAQGNPRVDQPLPLTTALQENRPAHGRFRIRSDGGGVVSVETSAVPLVGPDGFSGAIVVFWPAGGGAE